MDRLWKGSVAYRSEREHLDGVRLLRNQTLDRGDDAVLDVVDLPKAHGLGVIHGVINTVTLDLTVGLLRLLPPHHHGVLGNDLGLDVSWRTGRRLLTCASLHRLAGWTLTDCVHGRDTDFILCVGVQPTNAVARGGNVFHCLVFAVWGFGSILDDVESHWVWVAWIPGDGHTGGGGFSNHRGTRRLGESCYG